MARLAEIAARCSGSSNRDTDEVLHTRPLQAAGRPQQRLPDAEPKSFQQHVSQPPQPPERCCLSDTECNYRLGGLPVDCADFESLRDGNPEECASAAARLAEQALYICQGG